MKNGYMAAAALLGAIFSQVQLGAAPLVISAPAFSIADQFLDHAGTVGMAGEGSHFHVSNELPVDPVGSTVIAADLAEVGGLFGEEEVRAVVEFDLAGVGSIDQTTLTFQVANVLGDFNDQPVGGLFGQEKFDGTIDVFAYQGNGSEELADFQAPEIGRIGTFDTAGLSAGDSLSFDITQIVSEQLSMGNTALGVRLQVAEAAGTPDGAVTFSDFQVVIVPEPSAWILASVSSFMLCISRFARRATASGGRQPPERGVPHGAQPIPKRSESESITDSSHAMPPCSANACPRSLTPPARHLKKPAHVQDSLPLAASSQDETPY